MGLDYTNNPTLIEIDQLLSNYDWNWKLSQDTPPPETDRLQQLLTQFGSWNNKHRHAALIAVWRKHTDRPFRVGCLRLAQDVKPGEWFTKTQDSYRYSRISDSSAKFYNLSVQTKDEARSGGLDKFVFGMSPNGNLTEVLRERIVWTRGSVTSTEFGSRGWEEVDRSEYDPFSGYPEET